MSSFRHLPYRGRPHHEQRIAASPRGRAELAIVGGGGRAVRVIARASDIEAVCAQIREAASEGGAR